MQKFYSLILLTVMVSLAVCVQECWLQAENQSDAQRIPFTCNGSSPTFCYRMSTGGTNDKVVRGCAASRSDDNYATSIAKCTEFGCRTLDGGSQLCCCSQELCNAGIKTVPSMIPLLTVFLLPVMVMLLVQ